MTGKDLLEKLLELKSTNPAVLEYYVSAADDVGDGPTFYPANIKPMQFDPDSEGYLFDYDEDAPSGKQFSDLVLY